MLNVVKMDLFRLTRTKNTFIFLAIMGCFMVSSSYLFSSVEKAMIGEQLGMSQAGIDAYFRTESKAEMLTETTTGSNLIFMFPAVFMVLFSGAYQRNHYVRNISGFLPKKYELLVSNLVISFVYSLVFVFIAFSCASVGYSMFSPFYQSLPWGDGIEMFKFMLLYFSLMIVICTVTTFFTQLFQNQQVSIIFAVLYGSGVFVNMIGHISTTVFTLPDIRNYEPSGLLYRISLENTNYLLHLSIALGVTVTAFVMSVCLAKNRDYS